MAASAEKPLKRLISTVFRGLARGYVKVHRPKVVVVAGSVGKTSTKLMLAKLVESKLNVSYMDDSYNSGLGLYLSVFQLKVPRTALGWPAKFLAALWRLFTLRCDVLILEYGIDTIGEMDQMIRFIQPDIALLTAVTPEHMEFLKTIDIVGEEETKVLRAVREFGVVNAVDVNKKYLQGIEQKLLRFGKAGSEASYSITSLDTNGATVEFTIQGEKTTVTGIKVISEALIRQLSGAVLLAYELGISLEDMHDALTTIRPAASRMSLLEGVNDSVVIDDTANFSPVAGVAALTTLKAMKAKRRIAVLGNMHELGEFADEGYLQVAEEFKDLDMLVLVGTLSRERFGALARERGFVDGKTLFEKDTSLDAGRWLRDEVVQKGDIVLIKGPFGGWYMEETARLVIKNPKDVQYITRQSNFWYTKKRAHFGETYDTDYIPLR